MDSQRRRLNSSATLTRSKTVHAPSFPIKLFCKSILIVFTFFCILFWSLFIFKLPATSEDHTNVLVNPKRLHKHFFNSRNPNAIKARASWGFFSELMVGMLPDDLPFTVFVPSEKHFRRILGQKDNFAGEGNFTEEMALNSTYNNTMAVVSRILGFSTIPLHLLSRSVPLNAEVVVDSLSGFELQVARSSSGVLYVNNLSCEVTDARRGQIIVHVVHGVIMDAEFQQSTRPEEEDSD